MFEALVDIHHEEEYPTDVPLDALKYWISTLEDVGVTDIVLVSDDCFRHGNFHTLLEYVNSSSISTVKVMTTGKNVTRNDIRDVVRDGVNIVVPISFYNPFVAGKVYGEDNHLISSDRLFQIVSNIEAWHVPTSSTLNNAINFLRMGNVEWKGFQHPNSELQLPDQFQDELEQHDKELMGINRWLFVHDDVSSLQQYPSRYQETILGRGRECAGSIYVSPQGYVYGAAASVELDITTLSREDLKEIAESTEENMLHESVMEQIQGNF